MKILTKITVIILMAVMGYVEFAYAHEFNGTIGRKHSKTGGTDKYTVTCFDDKNGQPDQLLVQVFDTKRPRNPAQISIQAFVPATGAASELSVAPNDSSTPSTGVVLVGGGGPYEVDITKTRSKKIGAEVYFVIFHCQTAQSTGAVHTGTNEPELIQNQ